MPIQIDLIAVAGCYGLLLLLYKALRESKTHSIGSRISSMIFSTAFSFFVLDYMVNCIIITVDVFRSPVAILGYTGFVVMNGVLYWLIDKFADKVQLVETMNFVRTSVLFGNYFRFRDVDTQEKIGTNRMKKIYEEVHGKPFTDDVIATAYDEQVTKFKKVSVEELKEKKEQYPPEYFDELKQLKAMERTDVSVAFRFQLMDAGFHPFLQKMENFSIDPVTGILSIDIIAILERPIPVESSVDRLRLIERTYEALHILIAQEWFRLYQPFVRSFSVICSNRIFTEEMHEVVVPIMTMMIPLNMLSMRTNRITNVAEIQKIAEIAFRGQ
ncbi:MAG: hypothetical protein ACOYNS_06035 [Bacteroidota bacterium]